MGGSPQLNEPSPELNRVERDEPSPIAIQPYIVPNGGLSRETQLNVIMNTMPEAQRLLRTYPAYSRMRRGENLFAWGWVVVLSLFPTITNKYLFGDLFFTRSNISPENFLRLIQPINPSIFHMFFDMRTGAFYGTGEAIIHNINRVYQFNGELPENVEKDFSLNDYRRL